MVLIFFLLTNALADPIASVSVTNTTPRPGLELQCIRKSGRYSHGTCLCEDKTFDPFELIRCGTGGVLWPIPDSNCPPIVQENIRAPVEIANVARIGTEAEFKTLVQEYVTAKCTRNSRAQNPQAQERVLEAIEILLSGRDWSEVDIPTRVLDALDDNRFREVRYLGTIHRRRFPRECLPTVIFQRQEERWNTFFSSLNLQETPIARDLDWAYRSAHGRGLE